MAAGLKIINDFGTVLIDNRFPVMVVRNQGSATIPASGFLRIAGNEVTGKIAVRAGNVVSFQQMPTTIDPLPAGYYLFGQPGTSVQWWLFGPIQDPPSRIGMHLRNPDTNQLTFDAYARPMRVVDIRSAGSQAGWAGNAWYTGGRAYAVLPMVAAYNFAMTHTRVGGGSPNEFFQNEQLSLAGGAVNNEMVTFGMTFAATRSYGPYTGTVLPANYTGASQNAALAVIDVTGY